MLNSAHILDKLRAKCEIKDQCWIWKGRCVDNNPKGIRINGSVRTPMWWFFNATHENETINATERMQTLCDNGKCISHSIPITNNLRTISAMTANDYGYINWRFSKITEKINDCELITKKTAGADGYVQITHAGKDWYCHILRYCLEHKLNDVPENIDISHDCGNRNCVKITHLKQATKRENAQDKIKHHTDPKGERNPNSQITSETARKIIQSYRNGTTVIERAQSFGVSVKIIHQIDRAETWKHLMTDEEIQTRQKNKRKRSSKSESVKPKKVKVDLSLPSNNKQRRKVFERIKRRIQKNIKLTKTPDFETEHWVWQKALTKYGYGKLGIQNTFPMTAATAHRGAYQVFNDIILSKKIQVRHKCQEKRCCNPLHLEEGTNKQNAEDRIRDGKSAKGSKNPKAKITEEKAREIKASKGDGTVTERSERFGVSYQMVNLIDRGITWKHI